MPKGKYFFLKNPKTGLVMEVEEGRDRAGTPVVSATQRSPLESRAHQLWALDFGTGTILSKLNSFCMDVKDDMAVLTPFRKRSERQKWDIADGKVQSRADFEEVLGIRDNSSDPGAPITVQEFDDMQEGQQWSVEYTEAEYFMLRNQENDKILDVYNNDRAPGTKVILYRDKGEKSDNQLWYEDNKGIIRNKLTDFAMTGIGQGDHVAMHPYASDNPRQQWTISGNTIINRADPDEVLTYSRGGLSSRFHDLLIAADYDGSNKQLWFFDYLPNQGLSLNHSGIGKHVVVRSRATGLVLTASASSAGSPIMAAQRASQGSRDSDSQLWHLATNTIRSAMNDFCLDIEDDSIVLKPYNPTADTQKWQITGTKIQNKCDLECVFQLEDEEAEETNVKAASYEGSEAQMWEIQYVPARCFLIKSFLNGKALDVTGSSKDSGTPVIMWDASPADQPQENQLWYEDERGILRSKLNGYVLDTSDGTLKTRPCDPTNKKQQWIIAGDLIQNLHSSQTILDIKSRNTKNKAVIVPFKPNGQDNQRWHYVYVS